MAVRFPCTILRAWHNLEHKGSPKIMLSLGFTAMVQKKFVCPVISFWERKSNQFLGKKKEKEASLSALFLFFTKMKVFLGSKIQEEESKSEILFDSYLIIHKVYKMSMKLFKICLQICVLFDNPCHLFQQLNGSKQGLLDSAYHDIVILFQYLRNYLSLFFFMKKNYNILSKWIICHN